MKESEIKLLFIIELVGYKLNEKSLIDSGITTHKELMSLVNKSLLNCFTNKFGTWYEITTKGRYIGKQIGSFITTVSELTPNQI